MTRNSSAKGVPARKLGTPEMHGDALKKKYRSHPPDHKGKATRGKR